MLLSGCETTGGAGDSSRPVPTNLPIVPESAAELGYFPVWASNLSVSSGQRIHSARWLGDLIVVVERPRNLVTAVNATTGKVLWTTRLGEELEKLYTPIRRDDEIHVNSETRLFTLDVRTGTRKRTSNLPEPVLSGPSLEGRYAVFGSTNGKVFAVNVDTGMSRWRYDLASSVSMTPVAVDNEVFAVDDAGNYAMISLVEGGLKWRNRTFGPVSAPPSVGLGDVLVASEDRALYALNRGTGKINWAYRSQKPLVTGPFVLDRLVLQEDPAKGLVALDAFTGQQKWLRESTEAKPVGILGRQMLMMSPRELLFVDPDTGKTVDTLLSKPLSTVLSGEGDALVLITGKGQVVRLNPL